MYINLIYLVDPSSVNGKLLVLLYDYVMFYIFLMFFFFVYLVFVLFWHFSFKIYDELKVCVYMLTLVWLGLVYLFNIFWFVHCYLYVTECSYSDVCLYLSGMSNFLEKIFSAETSLLFLQELCSVLLGDKLLLILDFFESLRMEQVLSNFSDYFFMVFKFLLRLVERLSTFIDFFVFYMFKLLNLFMAETMYVYVFLFGFSSFYVRNYYWSCLLEESNNMAPMLEIEDLGVIEKYTYYCINQVVLLSYLEFNWSCVLLYKRVMNNIIWSNSLYIQSNFDMGLFLELVWTGIPTIILILMAVPSFWMLFCMDELVNPVGTVKCIGNQWYWTYEYGSVGVKFDSYMIWPGDGEFGYLRLLEVDNWLRLPVRVPFSVVVTSSDVIHSWSVPAFGMKLDGIPGRLNQVSFYGMRVGFFFGQCSELCGVNHAFMPMMVEVVPVSDFVAFLNLQGSYN